MDEDTADIHRRIAEARGVQERLTQMQHRIRQQHDQLEHVLRGFNKEDRPLPERLDARLARLRGSRAAAAPGATGRTR